MTGDPGELPRAQAEVVVSETLLEQLGDLPHNAAVDVLATALKLSDNPSGKHALGRKGKQNLSGWNTSEVLRLAQRIVFSARVIDGVLVIHALCIGPRRDSEVYTIAEAVLKSGALDDEQTQQVWEALALLNVAPELVGLDGWDYQPAAAPDGLRKTVISAHLLDPDDVAHMSAAELVAAMDQGWGEDGWDRDKALAAALAVHRSANPQPDPATVFAKRKEPRCGVFMPRARAHCVRREGHPGPHRRA